MQIGDASSIDDHVNKGVNQDFLMARPAPLPDVVDESIAFIATTPSRGSSPFGSPDSSGLRTTSTNQRYPEDLGQRRTSGNQIGNWEDEVYRHLRTVR